MQLATTTVYAIGLLTVILAFAYAGYLALWVKKQKNENQTIERIAG